MHKSACKYQICPSKMSHIPMFPYSRENGVFYMINSSILRERHQLLHSYLTALLKKAQVGEWEGGMSRNCDFEASRYSPPKIREGFWIEMRDYGNTENFERAPLIRMKLRLNTECLFSSSHFLAGRYSLRVPAAKVCRPSRHSVLYAISDGGCETRW